MKRILMGVVALLFILSLGLSADEKCNCGTCDKCKECAKCENQAQCPKAAGMKLVKMWEEAAEQIGKLTDEQKAEWMAGMKLMMECPCFQAGMAGKVLMKKVIHANWHLYELMKECCEGCKNAKAGECCEKCKEWMAKIPKEVVDKMMARCMIVTMMAETGKKIHDIVVKTCPCPKDDKCEMCREIKCDVKDMPGMKAACEGFTAEAEKLIALWKDAPAKFAALPAEKQEALKAAGKKMMDCPMFKVQQATCEYFDGLFAKLVEIEKFCGEKCPSEKVQTEEFKAVGEVFGACAAMNFKFYEAMQAGKETAEKMMPK